MKLTIRILALALALVMALSLAACGGTEAPGSSTETPESSGDTPSAANSDTSTPAPDAGTADEPVHLKWYLAGNAPQPDQETVSDAMEAYILENYGLNLDLELVVSDFGSFTDKAQVVIASMEEYDLMWTSSWCNNYYTNVSKNAFLPLDELLEEYGADYYAAVPAGIWEACRVNGSLYAAPSYQIECMQNCVAIPERYVEEFNLDVNSVQSIGDLNDFFYAVKAAYPDLYPLCVYANTFSCLNLDQGYEAAVNTKIPAVLEMYDESLQVTNMLEMDRVVSDLNLFYQWCQDGIIRSDAITVQESGYPDVKAGMHAAYIDTSWKPYCESTYAEHFGEPCVVIKLSDAYAGTANPVATLNAISNTSKHPEVAMQFLNILNTDPVLYNMICFGLEGVHYTVNDDGTVSAIDGAGYDPNCDWVFGNQFNAIPRAGQPADIWEKTKAHTDAANVSCAMGFSFDSAAVANEVAACTTVWDQYIAPITVGAANPDTAIPEALDKLEAAGFSTIVEELQRQLNEWAASK